MIYLIIIIAVAVLMVYLPLRYGLDGDKNPPEMPDE
jgi:hypothetical protein